MTNRRAAVTPTEPISAGKLNIFVGLFYQFRRSAKAPRMFAVIAGPGIIVRVADNDAGGNLHGDRGQVWQPPPVVPDPARPGCVFRSGNDGAPRRCDEARPR